VHPRCVARKTRRSSGIASTYRRDVYPPRRRVRTMEPFPGSASAPSPRWSFGAGSRNGCDSGQRISTDPNMWGSWAANAIHRIAGNQSAMRGDTVLGTVVQRGLALSSLKIRQSRRSSKGEVLHDTKDFTRISPIIVYRRVSNVGVGRGILHDCMSVWVMLTNAILRVHLAVTQLFQPSG